MFANTILSLLKKTLFYLEIKTISINTMYHPRFTGRISLVHKG